MPKKIMVVNDDQHIIRLICELLEEEGYTTTPLSIVLTDFDLVREAAPDLIILDLVLHGEAVGLRIIDKLKLQPDLAGIPIIICTGAIKEVRAMETHLKTKGVRIVLKPFDIDELLLAVSQMLEGAANEPAVQSTDAAKAKKRQSPLSRT